METDSMYGPKPIQHREMASKIEPTPTPKLTLPESLVNRFEAMRQQGKREAFEQVRAIVPDDADWDLSREEFLARLDALAKEKPKPEEQTDG